MLPGLCLTFVDAAMQHKSLIYQVWKINTNRLLSICTSTFIHKNRKLCKEKGLHVTHSFRSANVNLCKV